MHEQIIKSAENFGPGSTAYLNGDLISDKRELRELLLERVHALSINAARRRIFIDEISAVDDWASGIKPLLDQGVLADVLLVTTGSKASDLRRGMERLPGRKGRLARSSYIFFPLSFRSFAEQGKRFSAFQEDPVGLYLLSGGSPQAAAELLATGELPEYVLETTRDWIFGELARAGRSRAYLIAIFQALIARGGHPVGFTKLAREAGLANNTAASDYIDQLSDLFVVGPSYAWDPVHKRPNYRRPCKFHFVNMLAALSWMSAAPRSLAQLRSADPHIQGALYEWLAAQELFRRQTFEKTEFPEQSCYHSTENHELDFVLKSADYLEIKSGQTSSSEFLWFPKTFPNSRLTVVSKSAFETTHIKAIAWEDWLASA